MKTVKRVLIIAVLLALFFAVSATTCISPGLSQGGKIVFTRGKDIYIMNADGSDISLVTEKGDSYYPSFSTDGSKILFYNQRQENSPPLTPDYEIFIINTDGSGEKRLTYSSVNDETPSLSPNGKKILFCNHSADPDNYEIFIMDADGSNIKRITNDTDKIDDRYPVFSPDLRSIVFSRDADPAYPAKNMCIFIMNLDGSNMRQLTFSPRDDTFPSVSPLNDKIVFCRHDGNDEEIFIMNIDGTNIKQLTDNSVDDLYPAFSPDGNKIVYSSNGAIFIMNSDGSGAKQITFSTDDQYPCFAGKPR